MLAYAAACDLDHRAERIVFGAIWFAALGFVVAVESRWALGASRLAGRPYLSHGP